MNKIRLIPNLILLIIKKKIQLENKKLNILNLGFTNGWVKVKRTRKPFKF